MKNHTNATNLSKHLSMISNNLLVFMKHVLAIGRGLFFRLYNSNCIGRFASLLRTPGEIMYTCCIHVCIHACIHVYLYSYVCIHVYIIWNIRFYTIADQKQTFRHSSGTLDLRPPDQQDRPFLAT